MEETTSFLDTVQNNWLGSFVLNVLGYAIVVVPAGLLIKYLKESPQVQQGNNLRIIYKQECAESLEKI